MMRNSIRAVLPALLPCLLVHAGDAAGDGSFTLHTRAELYGGYDSNICVLRKPLPSPAKASCETPAAPFLGFEGGLDAEAFIADWFGFGAEPGFLVTGFLGSRYLMEPSFRLCAIFRPASFLRLDMGGRYRWFRFAEFPDEAFHEAGPLGSLTLAFPEHTFRVSYEWLRRYITEMDKTEWEGRLTSVWRWEPIDMLAVSAGVAWTRQEGMTDHSDLDQVLCLAGFRFSYAFFYFQSYYLPGAIKFARDKESHFTHHVSASLGFIPVEYVDLSLNYDYQELYPSSGPHGEDPVFSRHVVFAAAAFSWGLRRPAEAFEAETPPPVSCDGNKCTFSIKRKDAKSVHVAGTFNDWSVKRHPLEGPDAGGIWTATLSLPEGRHEYVFICDGDPVVPENAEAYARDDFGSRSAVVTVP